MVKRMRMAPGTLAAVNWQTPPLRSGRRSGRRLPRWNGSEFYVRGYMSEEVEALRRECDQGRTE